MIKTFFTGVLATTLLTSGCSRLPDVGGFLPGGSDADDVTVDPTDPCGAQNYTALLGSPLAAVTLPAELNDRVLRPGDLATTDFDPSRLNIELDDGGTIIGLSCG